MGDGWDPISAGTQDKDEWDPISAGTQDDKWDPISAGEEPEERLLGTSILEAAKKQTITPLDSDIDIQIFQPLDSPWAQAAQNQITEYEETINYSLTDSRAFVQAADMLAQFLQIDPALSAEKLDVLMALNEEPVTYEDMGRRIKNAHASQRIMIQVADLYNEMAQLPPDLTAAPPSPGAIMDMAPGESQEDIVRGQIDQLEKEAEGLLPPDIRTSFIEKSITGVAQQLPIWTSMAKDGALGAAALSFSFGAIAFLLSGGNPVITGGAIGFGAKAGAKIFGGNRMREIVRGFQLREFDKLEDEQGSKMDPRLKWVFADIIGTGEALLELAQIGSITRLYGSRQVKDAINRAIPKMVRSPAFNSLLVGSMKVGIGTAEQSAEEGVQKLWSLLGEHVATEMSNQQEGTEFEQRTFGEAFKEAWEETKQAMTSFWLTQVPGAITVAVMPAQQKMAIVEEKAAEADTVEGFVEQAREIVSEAEVSDEQLETVYEQVSEQIPIEEQITEETPPERAQTIATEELQTDLEENLFETEQEFIDFAHTMYAEENLPGDEVLQGMFEEQAVEGGLAIETPTEEIIRSKEEFVNWEFDIPEGLGNAPFTPKGAFELRRDVETGTDEMETVASVVEGEDQIFDYEIAPELVEAARNDELITVYRVDDNAGIIPGAYVTESREYAEQHGESVLKGDFFLQEEQVYADELMTRGDPHEFLYIPRNEDIAYERYQAQAVEAPEPITLTPTPLPEGMEEPRTLKQRIRQITGQTPIYRMVREEQMLKTKLAGEVRGAKFGAKWQREAQRRMDAVKKQKARIRGFREDIKAIQNRVEKGVGIDPVYKQQIEGILEGMSMTKLSNKKRARLEGTYAHIQANKDTHDVPDEVVDELIRLQQTEWDQLTPDQFEDVYRATMTAITLNDKKQKMRVGKQDREFYTGRDNVLGEINVGKKPKRKFWGPDEDSNFAKAVKKIERFATTMHMRPDVIIGQVFGNKGVGRDVFGRSIEEAQTGNYKYMQDMTDAFGVVLEKAGFKVRNPSKWLDQIVKVPNSTTGETMRMQRGQRISLYRHSLSEDNYESILTGVGFRNHKNRNEVFPLSTEDVRAFIDGMDEQEKIFAEATAPIFKRTGEDIQAEFLVQNGWEMPMLDTYMRKDSMSVGIMGGTEAEIALKQEEDNRQKHRVGVDKKMLITRKDVRTPQYINNIAEELNLSIMRAGAYINLEGPLQNANRLMKDMEFRKAMLDTPKGAKIYQYLDKYLRDVGGEHGDYGELISASQQLRAGITGYALGGELFVAAKQALSYPFYGMYVKPKYLLLGAIDETIHPKKTQAMHEEMSRRFRERVRSGFSRDISEALEKNLANVRLFQGKHKTMRIMMAPSRFVDKKTVSKGMSAAVMQALDELEEGQINRGFQDAIGSKTDLIDTSQMGDIEKMRLAYKFADYVSTRTQPQFAKEFLSEIQRSGELGKLISQFSSFTNQERNMFHRAMIEAKDITIPKPQRYKMLAVFSTGFVMNALSVVAINRVRDTLKGKEEEDKDTVAKGFLDAMAGMFYIGRDIEKLATSDYQDTFELPAARIISTIGRAGKAFFDALEADTVAQRQKAYRRFAELALDVTMLRFGIGHVFKDIGEAVIEAVK